MDTKELKKELISIFPNMVRAVRKGVGSCVGRIDVCCAVYDDAKNTFKCEIVRDYLKQNYPGQKFSVY